MSTATPQSTSPQSTDSVDLSQVPKTKLVFQSGVHQATYEHETRVTSIHPIESLSEIDQTLLKAPLGASAPFFAITTESTIFHPQGGGQPSDVGSFRISTSHDGGDTDIIFEVLTARVSIVERGIVLHFGRFKHGDISVPDLSGASMKQVIDPEKRLLYSRLHTAGHVLGTATRSLLEKRIDNFDELKASHFPDSASCEFQGLIDGKYKPEIQTAVDKLVATDAEVKIEWWTKTDFKDRGLERLLPSDKDWKEIATVVDVNGDEVELAGIDDAMTRIRVVNIVGAEVYPCGGTHIPSTQSCGKVTVRKISRQKGNSRVSYLVD